MELFIFFLNPSICEIRGFFTRSKSHIKSQPSHRLGMKQRAENREHRSRLKSALHSKSKIQIACRLINRYARLMIAQTEIRKLPLSEKLELLEAIWSELSSDPDNIVVPDWHKDILDERQHGVEQGSMNAIDWELAKQQINRRVL